MLALEDEWVWDSWYLHDGNTWHCWFLKAPKSLGDPNLRHWNVTYGHATSTDLVEWTYHGQVFGPSQGPAFDDYTTWTGSILLDGDGKRHCFYTGGSRAEDGKVQRIGHAVIDASGQWERVSDGPCLDIEGDAAAHYETEWHGRWHDRAMRDPWVMADPEGDGWLMYFTARAATGGETNDAGCIGFARSSNLYEWTLEPPVHVGGWGQLEVPQVFRHRDRWYCLFCMTSEHQAEWNKAGNGESGRGNHYLVADSPTGPWELPPGPALDVGSERYAARIVDHEGLKIIGFRDGEPDRFGGYIMDPEPVFADEDGGLRLGG